MHQSKVNRSKVGTGGKGKAIVMGMRKRGGDVRANVIAGTESAQLHPQIQDNIAPGSTLYTGEHRGYNGLVGYLRTSVNHSGRVFVDGDAHTNGIESFWALFKRGFHGVYRQISKKHLQKYVDECAYRLNRKGQELKGRFADVVEDTADNPQLPYKELIA